MQNFCFFFYLKNKKKTNSDESLDVDPNYDPSDFLKLPGNRQDNHDNHGIVKQELHQEMQHYEMQSHEYHQEYQQQIDYQQMDGVNIEVI